MLTRIQNLLSLTILSLLMISCEPDMVEEDPQFALDEQIEAYIEAHPDESNGEADRILDSLLANAESDPNIQLYRTWQEGKINTLLQIFPHAGRPQYNLKNQRDKYLVNSRGFRLWVLARPERHNGAKVVMSTSVEHPTSIYKSPGYTRKRASVLPLPSGRTVDSLPQIGTITYRNFGVDKTVFEFRCGDMNALSPRPTSRTIYFRFRIQFHGLWKKSQSGSWFQTNPGFASGVGGTGAPYNQPYAWPPWLNPSNRFRYIDLEAACAR